MYACMYAHVNVNAHVFATVYKRPHTYVHIYTYIYIYVCVCASPFKDPSVLALFGKNPLQYNSINPKEPFHQHCLKALGCPRYPHHLQYRVYAVGVFYMSLCI